MRRKIVGLAGVSSQFALADDGSVWFWNGAAWESWGRGELPEKEGLDYYAAISGANTSGPPWPTTQRVPPPAPVSTTFHADGTVSTEPVKRGPGRPRQVQP